MNEPRPARIPESLQADLERANVLTLILGPDVAPICISPECGCR